MLKLSNRLTVAALAASLLAPRWSAAAPADAEPSGPRIELAAFKVVVVRDAGGPHETLEPAGLTRPGDIVEYVVTCSNPGSRRLADVRITLPVPMGVEYLGALDGPAPDASSTDGTSFAAFPLIRTVRSADGRPVTEKVPLASYRALRWIVRELPAGARRVVRARMVLATGTPATSTPAASAGAAAPGAR